MCSTTICAGGSRRKWRPTGETGRRAKQIGGLGPDPAGRHAPKKDGFEVCREVRRAGIQTHPAVDRPNAEPRRSGAGMVPTTYVTNPTAPRAAGGASRPCCAAARSDGGDPRFGDAELDLTRCECVAREGDRGCPASNTSCWLCSSARRPGPDARAVADKCGDPRRTSPTAVGGQPGGEPAQEDRARPGPARHLMRSRPGLPFDE